MKLYEKGYTFKVISMVYHGHKHFFCLAKLNNECKRSNQIIELVHDTYYVVFTTDYFSWAKRRNGLIFLKFGVVKF